VVGSNVQNVYASALFEIGVDNNLLIQFEEELGVVSDILAEEGDLKLYLDSQGISKESKKSFISRVFSGNLNDFLVNFIKVTIDNDRQHLISGIYYSLIQMIDVEMNRQRVTIISSIKLDESILERIKDAVAKTLAKNIIIDELIDELILGGIIIKIGDLVIDGSLAKDLQNMKKKLLYCKVRSDGIYED